MALVTSYRYENGKSRIVNIQTADYTLTPDDNGGIIGINSGTGKAVTVPQFLPIGFNCEVVQLGAGQVTFNTSSTTVSNRSSHTKTAGQYARVSLCSLTADVFILSGDTAA